MTLRFSPARGSASLVLNSLVRGPTGAAATVTAGTTTTAVAGTSASVANSGTSAAAVFDFTIPRGADAGIKWLYDSTTSMADPGTGDIRFNNATLASVTAIAVSATGSGSDVSDYVATWDDSTNTVKGHILIREEAGSVIAVFTVSAVTDNSTWLQLTVTYVAGSLTLTAGDPLYVTHVRTGDAGAISGSLGATDNRLVRTDGTGGATLQNTGITVDDTDNVTGIATVTLPNTGLHIFDTDASHDLIIIPGSNLTADRNFTIVTGDAARQLTLTADSSIGGTAYVVGGTDVPVTDGGTGSSTAAGAATNLGLGTGDSPQFTAVNIGDATDTTISRASAGVIQVEAVPLYSNVPVNSQSAAYTTVLGDAQKFILHPTADNNARTFTIDSNANVAYPIGSCITFINQINTVTIAITADTLTLAGPGSTGSRTLAANGIATAIKVSTTGWVISGTGLT